LLGGWGWRLGWRGGGPPYGLLGGCLLRGGLGRLLRRGLGLPFRNGLCLYRYVRGGWAWLGRILLGRVRLGWAGSRPVLGCVLLGQVTFGYRSDLRLKEERQWCLFGWRLFGWRLFGWLPFGLPLLYGRLCR
jgi:hypothetical protein